MKLSGKKFLLLVLLAGNVSTAFTMDHGVSAAAQNLRFQCGECDFKTNRSGDWERHKRSHQGIRGFACSECPATFFRKSHLDAHELTHSSVKPFACKECGKTFTQKSNCDRHEQTAHRGLKPYVCDDCGAAFAQKGNLYRHKTVHNPVKDFLCAVCDVRCNSEKGLQKHMLLHDPAREFDCGVCGYRFKYRSHLYYHAKDIHKNKTVAAKQSKKLGVTETGACGSVIPSSEPDCGVAAVAPAMQTAMLRVLASVAADKKRKKMPTCHIKLYDASDDDECFSSSDDESAVEIMPLLAATKTPVLQTAGPVEAVIVNVLPACDVALPKKRIKSQPKRLAALAVEAIRRCETEALQVIQCQHCRQCFSSGRSLSRHMKKSHSDVVAEREPGETGRVAEIDEGAVIVKTPPTVSSQTKRRRKNLKEKNTEALGVQGLVVEPVVAVTAPLPRGEEVIPAHPLIPLQIPRMQRAWSGDLPDLEDLFDGALIDYGAVAALDSGFSAPVNLPADVAAAEDELAGLQDLLDEFFGEE